MPGIYRLNVPTGGGKTLSSLRYALAHAKKWGKQRLIFTSPLLSILEHHSNILSVREDGELDNREMAVESWNTPIIITTLVQLLQTLFSGKTTSIRRFQSLCDSVIVMVQRPQSVTGVMRPKAFLMRGALWATPGMRAL